MATTIIPSDLTVTTTESYTLNGVSYGNTINHSYLENSKVSKRIMNISPSTVGTSTVYWTGILALAAADGQGVVTSDEYRYFRITNLDTTNTLHLRFVTSAEIICFKILPLSSFLFMNDGIDSLSGLSVNPTFTDILNIAGQSGSATTGLDIEFIMVTS